MTGNVAPTLRSFYQLSVSTNAAHSAHARALSLVPLLCTAHLSLLLVSGAGKEDLLIPLDHSANEASFFEEIFLEAASRLHNLGFPVEVGNLVLGFFVPFIRSHSVCIDLAAGDSELPVRVSDARQGIRSCAASSRAHYQ